MIIYIDGLFYRGSGIGRYYESLVKEFTKRGIKVYTCIPIKLKDHFEKDFREYEDNIEPIFVDYAKFSIKGFWKQSKVLKNLESNVDLFFYPHVNLPFYVPKRTILTIHDLRPFTEYWDRSNLKKLIFILYLKRALKKSKIILTISNTVADELKNRFLISTDRLKVIYEFIDDKFYNVDLSQRPVVEEEYILFVGNRKKHKNLKNLILAFDKIKYKVKVKLVIAGSKEKHKDEVDELIGRLNLKNHIVEFIAPSDEVVINLYQHAKLFVFPSLFEGFGLPPLEAIALDCPVITSNILVLREILGEEIACFDPYDASDMAGRLLKVLIDTAYREYLINKGRQRLSFFDKNKIIDEHISLFNEVNGEQQ